MPAHKFTGAVAKTGRPRLHRLIVQEALEVSGKVGHRWVPLFAVVGDGYAPYAPWVGFILFVGLVWLSYKRTRRLVIATRDDMLVPLASALDVAAPVGWAETHIFDWGGHACNVTDPETFNRVVLDFLRR